MFKKILPKFSPAICKSVAQMDLRQSIQIYYRSGILLKMVSLILGSFQKNQIINFGGNVAKGTNGELLLMNESVTKQDVRIATKKDESESKNLICGNSMATKNQIVLAV